MYSLLKFFDTLIELYIWLVIIWVVMSWLVSFNVVNTHNRIVYLVGDFLHRITAPALQPIRRVLPNLGGIDISPFILILLLWLLRSLLSEYFSNIP